MRRCAAHSNASFNWINNFYSSKSKRGLLKVTNQPPSELSLTACLLISTRAEWNGT